jgi:hypothetical protein
MLPAQVDEFGFPYRFHHTPWGMELNQQQIFHFRQDVLPWESYFDGLVEDRHRFLQ